MGAQPIIVNNIIENNAGAAINIDANSMIATTIPDPGRATGAIQAFGQFSTNSGPLVRLNSLANNSTNGMVIRSALIENTTVWDDTDIVHVVQGTMTNANFATGGGLLLESSDTQSLVVKLSGCNRRFNRVPGSTHDITDRIGGTVQILGTVGHPVIMTSLNDNTVGAGFTPSGTVQDLTSNNPLATPKAGDWGGILFDQYSNDQNVAVVNETEDPNLVNGDTNNTPSKAQALGLWPPT